jgi:hypothetical protein
MTLMTIGLYDEPAGAYLPSAFFQRVGLLFWEPGALFGVLPGCP